LGDAAEIVALALEEDGFVAEDRGGGREEKKGERLVHGGGLQGCEGMEEEEAGRRGLVGVEGGFQGAD